MRPAGAAWSNVRDLLKYVQMELAEGALPDGRRYVGKDILLEQEPELDPSKDVRGNVEDGVRPLRELLDSFDAVSAAFAEPDADFDTLSSVPVEPLYTPIDAEIDHDKDLGLPGEYPYTRGVYTTMYRGRLWTFRQFSGFGNALETNRRYKFLLEQGQTGLSVAFDLPTQMGHDSDAQIAGGEGGKVGVAID